MIDLPARLRALTRLITMSRERSSATLDLSTTLSHMVEGFSLRDQKDLIPRFDGRNLPLNDFIQDVRNAAAFIPEGREAEFTAAVIAKLSSDARNCVHGRDFNNVEDLIKVLIKRLNRGKDFDYYSAKISQLRMRSDESIGQFYDRVRILIACSRSAWKSEKNIEPLPEASDPLSKIALRGFIDALPSRISEMVELREPKTLDDAFNIAEKFVLRSERNQHSAPEPSSAPDENSGETKVE